MTKQNSSWLSRLVVLLAITINTALYSVAWNLHTHPGNILRRTEITNSGLLLQQASLDYYDSQHWGEHELLQKIQSYMSSKEETELIKKAIQTSKVLIHKKHWKHIYGTACIIADLRLDATSIIASLLLGTTFPPSSEEEKSHDAMEQFGEETYNLVTNVRSLERMTPYQHSTHDKDKYQKLVVALAQNDIRAILIKLANQTQKLRLLIQKHNMTNKPTILSNSSSSSTQEEPFSFVARETLDVYAPLAHRLGVYALKTEMEDMSLRLWKPKEYRKLQTLVAARKEESQLYTAQVIKILEEKLECGGMTMVKNGSYETTTTTTSVSVSGRAKSYYSIYQKMTSKDVAFGDIKDLMAFRILVHDVGECYQALGIIYDMWKPLKGRYKDYIAQPKLNGYKSLHTTLMGHEDKPLEVQIRTYEMHEIAESGIAAHWIYKGKNNNKGGGSSGTNTIDDAQHFQCLRQLVESVQIMDDDKSPNIDESTSSSEEESRDKEIMLQGKEIFVFSPQGHLFSLSEGSSVLDFAYHIHSDLGNHCTGAKVNKRMVPLKYQLNNADSIQIIKASNQTPKKEWLHIVKTSKAKSRIKSWLKRHQRLSDASSSSANLGQEMLERALKKHARRGQRDTVNSMSEYKENLDQLLATFQLKDEQQLFEAIAYGRITTRNVLHEMFNSSPSILGRRHQQPYYSLLHDDNDDDHHLQLVVLKSLKSPRDNNNNNSERKSDTGGIVIGGETNMLISFCRNCNPLHGENVQGVITMGNGVKIHRLDCRYLRDSDMARRLDAVWDDESIKDSRRQPYHRATTSVVVVEVICDDYDSPPDVLLASMSQAINKSSKINIIKSARLKKVSNGRSSLVRFELLLNSIDELRHVVQQLQQEPYILSVKRR